ncbi:NAD-binding protein [Fomitopsis schrenkii]|uniref:NAD-binding protein n=1 Tax=Fomitopsis schrenkii TaxID=2126942 RepID=S8F2Y1_FOMSC|nr:NAD-binding protein [Fomitopsis schrenkii]
MSEVSTWLVTGHVLAVLQRLVTSRGIGFELVRQLVSNPNNIVVATCREPSRASKLHALKDSAKEQLYIVALDVSSEASIRGSVAEVSRILGDRGLDYLYNNAAVTEGDDSAFNFSYDGLLDTLRANVAGPALLGMAYLPLLEQGRRKVIVNMTSGLASIGLDFGAKNATYSISKTALNMLAYKQAKTQPDLIAYVVDPGWVKTDMGGPNAMMEPEESVARLIKLATTATTKSSGKFFRHDGEEIPW